MEFLVLFGSVREDERGLLLGLHFNSLLSRKTKLLGAKLLKLSVSS